MEFQLEAAVDVARTPDTQVFEISKLGAGTLRPMTRRGAKSRKPLYGARAIGPKRRKSRMVARLPFFALVD
ncbi:MAG TPA: hypothetical protein VK747_02830 [Blastocatellia bacterium]|nr:hypothetical protein [Blastocatellia bacterium]